MQNNTAAQFLPIVSDDKKVDIVLSEEEAMIKLSTWTESLGWTCQKTMRLDASMLDELHHVIAAARYKFKKQISKDSREGHLNNSNVIEFPGSA